MNKNYLIITALLLLVAMFSTAALGFEGIPRVQVSLLEYEPSPVQPGQVMDVVIELDNLGTSVDDASLYIVSEYPFTVEHSQDVDSAKNLGSIGYSRKLQFRVRVADDAKDGITPLRVRYDDSFQTGKGYFEKTFDIDIQTFDAHVDIVSVQQVPPRLEPGEIGKVILTLLNADDRPLKNVDVTLDLTHSFDASSNMDNMIAMQAMVNARLEEVNRRVASGISPLTGATPMMNGNAMDGANGNFEFKAFSLVDSTNQKTINRLGAREEVKVEFDIMALPDAMPNPYATPLYLNYNDEENNPFHLRVEVPLMIDAKPDLFIDIQSTNLRTDDIAANVVFTVANRGLSELRFITIELEDDESFRLLTAPRSIYVGSLLPGESKEGTFSILPEDKELNLTVVSNYRDSFNKVHEETSTIPFTVINKNYYRDLPYEMWISWIILGIVLLLVTIYYVRQMSNREG